MSPNITYNGAATVADAKQRQQLANGSYNYAYDATLSDTPIATYNNHLGSGIGTFGGNNRFYDPWAQEVRSSATPTAGPMAT